MQQTATGKLLSCMKRSLGHVLDAIGPHLAAIEKDWRALMQTLPLRPGEMKALRGLVQSVYGEEIRGAQFSAHHRAVRQQAEGLISRGVPEEHAMAALSFQLETCLPRVNGASSSAGPLNLALTRLTAAAEQTVISAYAEKHGQSNRDLQHRLREVEQRLRNFTMHLIHISEQDRSRLSRDLHDEIGHNLLVLKLYMEMIALDLKEGHTAQVTQKLDEAVDLVGQAIDGVRRLAFDLGPAILDEMGFVPSIRRYSRQFTARTAIKVRVSTQRMPSALPSSYEVAFYRVFQGALSNVAAHSKADMVLVTLGRRKDVVYVVIEDNGIGFDIQQKLSEPPEHAFGLNAMRQRIELLGGTIQTESYIAAPGKKRHGTRIEVRLPLLEIET